MNIRTTKLGTKSVRERERERDTHTHTHTKTCTLEQLSLPTILYRYCIPIPCTYYLLFRYLADPMYPK